MGYNNLIIFLTNRCKGGCPTCNVNALPENTGEICKADLNTVFADPNFSNRIGNYLIWTGGEPFENFTVLKYGISMSRKNGFKSEILSSGYWFRDHPELLKELIKIGPFSLRISIDPEHLRFSGESLLQEITDACFSNNVELNFTVRDIPGSKSDSFNILERIKKMFPAYALERKDISRWVHCIPHVPVNEKDPYDPGKSLPINYSGCRMVFRDVVVGWDARIYPCCGLFSLPGFEKYSVGSFRSGDQGGSEYQRAIELFKLVVERGPVGIREKFGAGGERSEFHNLCHECLHYLKKYDLEIENFLMFK